MVPRWFCWSMFFGNMLVGILLGFNIFTLIAMVCFGGLLVWDTVERLREDMRKVDVTPPTNGTCPDLDKKKSL